MTLSTLITRPDNSLVYQSRDATYHPGVANAPEGVIDKRNIRVNGDGFGIAWYDKTKPNLGACSYKSISPAWNDRNLHNLAEFIDTELVFAHVRAVTPVYIWDPPTTTLTALRDVLSPVCATSGRE